MARTKKKVIRTYHSDVEGSDAEKLSDADNHDDNHDDERTGTGNSAKTTNAFRFLGLFSIRFNFPVSDLNALPEIQMSSKEAGLPCWVRSLVCVFIFIESNSPDCAFIFRDSDSDRALVSTKSDHELHSISVSRPAIIIVLRT